MPQDEEWSSVYDVVPDKRDDLREVVRGVRLFETLDESELRKLTPLLHHRDYFPRDVIVKQGAPGAGLYILAGGEAEVVLESESGDNLVLATLGPGRMFGEMSLLDGEPRTASVVSTARSHVLGFFRADLMDLAAHSPSLGFKVFYRLGQLTQERLIETLAEYRNLERSTRRDRRRGQTALLNQGKDSSAPASTSVSPSS